MIGKLAVGAVALMAGVANAQVTATGTMGTTNPPQATTGTEINQKSMARLLSLNAIDDFCLFGPIDPDSVIGETEAEEVAWCVQPRNNARVIPDGTLTAVHFVKTPLYWQIQGFGDLTKLNIQANDQGGELDPHGATGLGNPVGGNVTTNATGQDVSYEEWMNYMSYDQFCLRICIAENSTYSAAEMCQHTLDEMGCSWVMPGDYTDNSFTECDGDAAYPPGIYPGSGTTSTFQQRYTGTFTDGAGKVGQWTQGQTVTPQSAFSTPATSNCKTYSTVSNGIASLAVAGGSNSTAATSGASSGSAAASASATGSGASGASAAASGASSGAGAAGAAASRSTSGAAASASGSSGASSGALPATNFGSAFAGVFSVIAVAAGAGAFLL